MAKYLVGFLLVVGAILAAACGDQAPTPTTASEAPTATAQANPGPQSSGTPVPFADAQVYIEFNSTDEDVGFHATFDAPGWTEGTIASPDGTKLVEVRASGSTQKYGLSELFFEGAEPPLEEQPLEEFLARFPEGEYVVSGQTTGGQALESFATFTHRIPAGPVMVSPVEDEPVALENAVIQWEPVTSPQGIEISGYQLIILSAEVPQREPEPALPVELILELPPEVTSFRIPTELLTPDSDYEYEVIAREESGNQTITAGEFITGED